MNVKPIVSTATNRNQFSGQVLDTWGEWALSHETTYTGAGVDPLPTDHGAYQEAYTIYQILKDNDHPKTKEALADLERVEAALAVQI